VNSIHSRILRKEYIEDSIKAGRFLDEAKYEWAPTSDMSTEQVAMAMAPKRWRLQVQKERRMAFEDWCVVLVVDSSRREGLVRLLKAGGAKLYKTRSTWRQHLHVSLLLFIIL
jgi:hypothetical protein